MSSLLRLKLLLWALSLTHSFGDKCTVESMLSLASLRKKSDVKPETLTFYLPLRYLMIHFIYIVDCNPILIKL